MTLDDYQERWRIKGIQPSLSMYNVGHEVTPNFGGLKVSLNCIRPDVEIRYTVDGTEPNRYASLYRRPWIVKKTQVIKCATFKDGEQMGQTLVLPIRMNPVTGRNLLRSNPIERRMVNGVRGSLKCTDGEWASWAKNDSIVLTFDVGSRKGLHHLLLGCLNNYGLGIHKPKKIEVWLSDNDVAFWKVADKNFNADEIFREGRFVEDLDFKFEGTARYVRLVMKGIGKCPSYHVRPGMEARIFLDEVVIE
jgi:hexosaminidase